MFCPQCGAAIEDTHAFCPQCGVALPAARHWPLAPAPSGGPLHLIGDPGIRLLAYAVGGLLAVLVLTEVVKALVGLALPLLIVLAILYWARERRRRYY